jgi:hypothetical protein
LRLINLEKLELFFDRPLPARQEARPDPISAGAEPQIETRGLKLGGIDVDRAADHLAVQHQPDFLTPQKAERITEKSGILIFQGQRTRRRLHWALSDTLTFEGLCRPR